MANDLAKTLKALHIPGNPIIFANVWDISSLSSILSLNGTENNPVRAVASASWAIAAGLGLKDEELTFEDNIAAVSKIAPLCKAAGLPLSVDLQDGYGPRLEEVVTKAIEHGAVGANIEDSYPSAGFDKGIEGSLYPLAEQVERLKLALQAASDATCPEFVLNARCDVFLLGLDPEIALAEAIKRGKAYLAVGATTVFYWGGSKGLSDDIVRSLSQELEGRVAVKLAEGSKALGTKAVGELGVARISVGPSLYRVAMNAVKEAAKVLFEGGRLP